MNLTVKAKSVKTKQFLLTTASKYVEYETSIVPKEFSKFGKRNGIVTKHEVCTFVVYRTKTGIVLEELDNP